MKLSHRRLITLLFFEQGGDGGLARAALRRSVVLDKIVRNLLMPFPIFGHFRALTGISVKNFGRCPARNFATVVLTGGHKFFEVHCVPFEGISCE